MPAVRRWWRAPRAALAAGLTLALVAVHLLAAGRPLLNNFETQILNLRFQIRGPLRPGPEAVLLLIDDRTIAELGEWPLSRAHFADAVRLLAQDGARLVVFNLLFTDPDAPLPATARLAIRRARDALHRHGEIEAAAELERLLREGAGADRAFEVALREAGNVLIPFAFVFDPRRGTADGLPPYLERAAFSRYRSEGGDAAGSALQARGVLTALPGIAGAARDAGHVTLAFDTDGTPRYEYLVIGYAGDFFPSLPLAAVRAFLDIPPEENAVHFPWGIALGERFVPTGAAMRMVVNYYGPPGTFPTYSLVDLIEGRLPAGTFDGKLVLVGGAALGIDDAFPSPFAGSLPGVERQATIFDNILHGRAIRRPAWAGAVEALATIGAGIAALSAVAVLPVAAAVAAGFGLLTAWTAVNFAVFARAGIWINYTVPTLAIALNFAALLAARVWDEERRRRRAERQRANLGRYFSPNVVEQLAGRDAAHSLDRTIEAAVLFVDIIGFTHLAERMAPAEAIALLRAFHRRVEKAVFAHGGTLDKFLGDGALATFGPPEPGPDDARNAVACARTLAADLAGWSRELTAAGQAPIAAGIGLHYGPVLMGDVGGEHRFEFTVVGDTVNVASRLQDMTRELGITLLASEAAVAAARRAADGEAVTAGLVALPPRPIHGRDGAILLWGWHGPG